MKRILTTMCALTLLLAASVPALAVEPEQSASYYPTSVEEYMEGDSPRIKKVYQLSLADDPSQIPTEDFERDGRLYYLLDMTRKDEVGVDIQTITQTKTLASETNNMEKILQSLEPQMEVTTEDGYTGTLTLNHTTVKVAADGYAIRGAVLSASARASGFSMILNDKDTMGVPILSGHCAVYGKVSGDVRLTGSALVISGEEIRNDTLDTLVISGKNRSVIRDSSRDELAPQQPAPSPPKKQKGCEMSR